MADQKTDKNKKKGAARQPPVAVLLPGVKPVAEHKNLFERAAGAVGNLLYALGFGAEYYVVQFVRRLRNALRTAQQLAGLLLGRLFTRLGQMLKRWGRDLLAPFRRLKHRRAQLRRVRQRARKRIAQDSEAQVKTFFGLGAKTALQFVLNVAGILLPVAATVVLGITVNNVLDMQYALAVEINGKVVGYVADQSVVENAKGLLRDRIQLAGNQEIVDWQLAPSYTLAKAIRYTTTHQLVNEILLSESEDPSDIVQATGLYIGGELYAVTTEGERLKAYLDGRLGEYETSADEGALVGFTVQVECEPNENDVFFASSVEPYDKIVARLEENVSDDETDAANGEQTLAEIAETHNVLVETLKARNPALELEGDDFVPEAGTQLLIRRAKPFLQVQVAFRTKSTENIAFETVERETDERPRGAVMVVQEGADGQREVWYDYVYVDGELEGRVLVEEMTVILAQPVEKIVEIGTQAVQMNPDFTLPEGGYGGSYMFPVPSSPYSSRGISSYHRGLDINATTGEPIFACQGGTVTTAEWHYSYGYHIVIAHPDGVTTLYAHCSALYVSAGQQVSQGQHIGAVGSTGNSSGPHCHLEVRVNGSLVDPVAYVGYPY